MGFFKDKKFEELDWISQAVEPINSPLNDILASLPDRVDITFQMYKKLIGSSSWRLDLSKEDAVIHLIDQSYIVPQNSSLEVLLNCFVFEVKGDPVANWKTSTIECGSIALVKTQSTIDEKVLSTILGSVGIDKLWNINGDSPDALSRANEVMDLLGSLDKETRSRTISKKRRAIMNRLSSLFKNNEWNIKDTELADKVGFWIYRYIELNDISAFTNFCKLKVMTHKGQPIYSMEEVI